MTKQEMEAKVEWMERWMDRFDEDVAHFRAEGDYDTLDMLYRQLDYHIRRTDELKAELAEME